MNKFCSALDLILRLLKYIESRLISNNLFRHALIFRFISNLVLLFLIKISYDIFNTQKYIRYLLLKYEVKSMSSKIFYSTRYCMKLSYELSNEIKKIILIKHQSLLHNSKLDKILIIGPERGKEKYVNTPDLVILLNPNLMALDLKVNQNYMIVLNSNKSKLFRIKILEIANLPNVLLILNKNQKITFNNRKVQSFEMDVLHKLTLKSNGLNLLPISLLSIIPFHPKVIEIIGCDFYLGLKSKKNTTDILEYSRDTNVKKISMPTLPEMAFHNPFDQLTCFKVLSSILESSGCKVFFDYNSLSYYQMAKGYNSVMPIKKYFLNIF